jgi:GR25 family glycosyltransferase involved in LPS biosynthesis
MNYLGFYINLDCSPQRKNKIETQLEQLQLISQYSRFPAVEGNMLNLQKSSLRTGEIGCFTSHDLLLEKNLNQTHHLHVIEDDILLSQATDPILQKMINSKILDNMDIIFTDISIPLDLVIIKALKNYFDSNVVKNELSRVTSVKQYTVINLMDMPFSGFTSYLINKNAISKMHNILKEEMEIGPRQPIDLFIRDKVRAGEIKAGCIFPFITSIQLDSINKTTIRGRYKSDLSILAVQLIRHSFFVECDWDKCNQLIAENFPPIKKDRHHVLLSCMFDFILSKRFQNY